MSERQCGFNAIDTFGMPFAMKVIARAHHLHKKIDVVIDAVRQLATDLK